MEFGNLVRAPLFAFSSGVTRGTFANRPASDATKVGRIYIATDWPVAYRDNGSTWDPIAVLGPLAVSTADVTDDANVQGVANVTHVTYTIPANVLRVGTVIRGTIMGAVGATTVAGPTMNFKATIGGSASGADTNSLDFTDSLGAAAQQFFHQMYFTVRAIGLNTTTFQNQGQATTNGGTNLQNVTKGNAGQTTGKDSTGTIVLAMTTNWSAATAGNLVTGLQGILELVNP